MDPQATWDQLLAALAAGDWDQIEDLADALLEWLNRDGFPPVAMGVPNLGPEWEAAICRAGCQFALDIVTRRWSVVPAASETQEEERP